MEGWFSWAGYVSTKFLCIYGLIHSVFLHSSANWALVPWSDSLLHSACLKWSFWGVASEGSQRWLWRMNWSNRALCVMMSLVTILVELFVICWISKHERWKFECQHFLTVGADRCTLDIRLWFNNMSQLCLTVSVIAQYFVFWLHTVL